MKSVLFLSFLVLVYVSSCFAKDLIVGTSYNTQLVWQENAEYTGIPFKKRVKERFYSDPGQQIIKGIIARDVDRSESTAIVTAGGVGYSYVNIRMKSGRGSGLNYHLEIYV